ncbi:MAG TPA: Uma2 family endonuclease [Tepidisphaeraceae bacterium]|nr:Uma2 family endonuclease [Tepidisphaeraceae bacterium]
MNSPLPGLPLEPPVRTFTLEEYHELYETGILVERGLELINGVVHLKASERLRRFSLDEYHRMLDVGILREGEAIELVDGALRHKMTKGTRHDAVVDAIAELLRPIASGWRVRVQSAISAAEQEPEPDIVIARGPVTRYLDHHPRPHEIALIVEVADTSVNYDRGRRKRAYANVGIVEYWVASIPERVIDVYADPTGATADPDYRIVRRYAVGESVPVMIESREVGVLLVDDALPLA